jgi:AraC-like DNA-binding protein
MKFQFYPTTRALQPFLQGYLEADSRKSTSVEAHTLFPNGFSGIFFNFGNLGKLLIKEAHATPAVSIFGQIDQSFEAIHWPGSYSLGVLFKPTALSRFLRIDMSELTNRTEDGTKLNKNFLTLHQQLGEVQSVANKIELLDRFFLTTLRDLETTSVVDRALDIIHHASFVSIRKVSEELGISERYLETQFKKNVGLSPKTYSLITRFKKMEQQLKANASANWGRLDFAHEYYDQNHFIKEFRRFTGHTPSEYLLRNFEMGRSYLVS